MDTRRALGYAHPAYSFLLSVAGSGRRPVVLEQLFPLKHRHKENKAIQRYLKISFRELLTKLQYYGSIN